MDLLDKERPGWLEGIDLSSLDLGTTDLCVLGQIYGEYQRGRDALGIPHPIASTELNSSAYGFSSGEIDGGSYPKLTKIWREEITARRN